MDEHEAENRVWSHKAWQTIRACHSSYGRVPKRGLEQMDEQVMRDRYVSRKTTGGGGTGYELSGFPSDLDGLVPNRGCPRCHGSLLVKHGECWCLSCGCLICDRCGGEMTAELCPACDPAPERIVKGARR